MSATTSGTLPYLITAALALLGCTPPPKVPITGEAEIAVVERRAGDIRLQLRNQAAHRISFWGARDWWWQDVSPQGPQFECVLPNQDQVDQRPLWLVDGPDWKQITVESGETIGIVVSNFYLKGSDGALPTGRCKFVLHLEGNAVVKSEMFESRPWGVSVILWARRIEHSIGLFRSWPV